jgi:hypothetical protein
MVDDFCIGEGRQAAKTQETCRTKCGMTKLLMETYLVLHLAKDTSPTWLIVGRLVSGRCG